MRGIHGFKDGLPEEVEIALRLQRQLSNDPGPETTSRGKQRIMLRWNTIANYSIMMLSMLAFLKSFQHTVEHCSEDIWVLIWSKIIENHQSIEYFAKARGLQWKDLLERYHNFTLYIGATQTLGEAFPGNKVPIEHPHTRVVPASGGRLRVPRSRTAPETPQIIIEENVYDEELWRDSRYPRPSTWPGVWPYPFNPMTRIPLVDYDEYCYRCESNVICDCQIKDFKTYGEPLLELRDYEGRGVGLRTLIYMEKGTILAEFLGEIVPNGDAYDGYWNLDPIYGWQVDIGGPDGREERPVATISAKEKGNWCRFVNHSCRNSLVADTAIVGEKRRLLYFAARDILPFEELTVNYGDHYFTWPDHPCRCGEDNCKFSGPRQLTSP